MITVFQWALVVFLWIMATAFLLSDVLMVLALVHNRKDRELVLVVCAVLFLFTLFGCGAAYAALSVGRCL